MGWEEGDSWCLVGSVLYVQEIVYRIGGEEGKEVDMSFRRLGEVGC